MNLNDIFGELPPIDLSESICHSGGAIGSDTYWEEIGSEYGVNTNAYSYKTEKHTSPNKSEINETTNAYSGRINLAPAFFNFFLIFSVYNGRFK